MTDRRALWSVALALLGAAVLMLGSRDAGGNNAGQPPSPPLLDVESEPRAVLYWEYHETGWGPQDAAALAERTITIIRGNAVEPFVATEAINANNTLLDPDSEPLAIFYWAFRDSGHAPETSANQARRLQRRVLGVEPEDPDAAYASGASGSDIQVYPTRIVICENGQRFLHRGWIDAPCWETTVGGCTIAIPKCPDGELPWFTIGMACEDFPCSWLRVGDLTPVSPETETVDCECFNEIDCREIEPPSCCDHLNGCGGPGVPCPEC